MQRTKVYQECRLSFPRIHLIPIEQDNANAYHHIYFSPKQLATLMQTIELQPIGLVHSQRTQPIDDQWDSITSSIDLDAGQFDPTALQGLEEFSHIEVLYSFHQVPVNKVETGARHPRGREDWPCVGIFAQRGKNRPNRVGLTVCRLIRIEGLTIHVAGLDAIDGSPVIDIKPVMFAFDPRGPRKQPSWAEEIMRDYW